jgi:hypothetical protein
MVTFRNAAVAVLAVSAVIVAFSWFQSDASRIKKRLKSVSELASRVPGEHELIAGANARKIGEMTAETIRIEIPSYNISRTYTRKDIPANVMMARSRYLEMSFDVYDLEIRFPEDQIARATFTAYIQGVLSTGEQIREAHEIVCWLEKIDKDWFFSRIEFVSVLER